MGPETIKAPDTRHRELPIGVRLRWRLATYAWWHQRSRVGM